MVSPILTPLMTTTTLIKDIDGDQNVVDENI
jgi:hypothetical protein